MTFEPPQIAWGGGKMWRGRNNIKSQNSPKYINYYNSQSIFSKKISSSQKNAYEKAMKLFSILSDNDFKVFANNKSFAKPMGTKYL